jgi:phosphatidylglycerophosphatase A
MNDLPGQADEARDSNLTQIALKTPSGLLAFGFGSGLSPFAPGTAGTIAAIPFAIAIKHLDNIWFWLVLMSAFVLGVWLCGRVSGKLGVHDHGGIVWDEMVGYWLAVALVPTEWEWLLAAFMVFRFFDIFKPWPIKQLDRHISGGFGIMIDDVLAAIYTMVLLQLAQNII